MRTVSGLVWRKEDEVLSCIVCVLAATVMVPFNRTFD